MEHSLHAKCSGASYRTVAASFGMFRQLPEKPSLMVTGVPQTAGRPAEVDNSRPSS